MTVISLTEDSILKKHSVARVLFGLVRYVILAGVVRSEIPVRCASELWREPFPS